MLFKLQIWLLLLMAPALHSRVKWVVVSGCTLRISGSTNVNKFGCEITNYSNADTIVLDGNQQPLTMTGSLNLDINRFSCANEMMTKDLRKILKAQTHPQLHIRFLSLNKLPCWQRKEELIHGLVHIDLAGVVKKYDIEYTFVRDDQDLITLTGRQQVCFSDFNLQAPRKLGGMIQARDQLEVLFCLKLRTVKEN